MSPILITYRVCETIRGLSIRMLIKYAKFCEKVFLRAPRRVLKFLELSRINFEATVYTYPIGNLAKSRIILC